MRKKERFFSVFLGCCMLGLCLCACSSGKQASEQSNAMEMESGPAFETEPGAAADSGFRKVYPAVFAAKGTDADTYRANMKEMVDKFGEYYAGTDELDKVEGYDEPVTVMMTGYYSAGTQDAYVEMEKKYGETLEDNRWADAIRQLLNVDVKLSWNVTNDEYNQKLRLDMAADDLPDIFMVKDQNDIIALAESGAIWDMTDIIDQYATKECLEIWESDGGIAMDQASVDGRIYGIPSKKSDTDYFSYLWIRNDWMEKLNLEYPTTMDGLTEIMDAFVNADFDGNGKKDTVGIMLDKTLYYPSRGIFSAFGAYPEFWVEKDGALEWGGVSEENKAALACLNEWYQKGYINQEFVTQDNATAMESVISGKCGIVYGGHWLAHQFGSLQEIDPESEWYAVKLPTGNGEEVRSPMKSAVEGWLVVNSRFEHPEIALKIFAVNRAALQLDSSSWWIYELNASSGMTSPVRLNVSAMDNFIVYENLMEAYENGGDTSVLKGKAVPYWENLHGPQQWQWELMFGPGEHTAMAVLGESLENDKTFYDSFYGTQSAYMQERWSTVKDEQLIAYTKMIAGEIGLEEGFDQWKETFESLGGEKITREVNEWYKSR